MTHPRMQLRNTVTSVQCSLKLYVPQHVSLGEMSVCPYNRISGYMNIRGELGWDFDVGDYRTVIYIEI